MDFVFVYDGKKSAVGFETCLGEVVDIALRFLSNV
jgi:hypothetical protein